PPLTPYDVRCLQAAGSEGATPEAGPWRLSLDMPTYMPCMQHLESRGLREKLYRAFTTRASGEGEEGSNEAIIERVLELRKCMAGMLGYGSYAEVSLTSKV
ncbi:unnamed protein product, partial [Discosporangium mesarthrocarpum]